MRERKASLIEKVAFKPFIERPDFPYLKETISSSSKCTLSAGAVDPCFGPTNRGLAPDAHSASSHYL